MTESRHCVSVVVPFRNCRAHLPDCLDALTNQLGVPGTYEVILIDNGSSDDSASIASARSRVTVLRESKPGPYAARNAGIRHASAPIIAFTDGDCAPDPDWLSTICDRFREPALGGLVGNCRYPRAASPPLKLVGAYENAKASFVFSKCGPMHRFGYTNNMAVRRSLFDTLGLFEEWPRAADTEFVHRAHERQPSLRFEYCREMRVEHREFLCATSRLRRLLTYRSMNSRVHGFRELDLSQRLDILRHLVPRGRPKPEPDRPVTESAVESVLD